MSAFVEMIYNPYLPELTFQINGQEPSSYSRLIQFEREDIWEWKNEIFDVLYQETNDDYVIEFQGREYDAILLQQISLGYSHCLQFTFKNFIKNVPFQERLVQLNQLIKSNKMTRHPFNRIDSQYIYGNIANDICASLESVTVRNLYCENNITVLKKKEEMHTHDFEHSYLYVIGSSIEELKPIENVERHNPIFYILIDELASDGNKFKVKEWKNGVLIQLSFNNLIIGVFNILLWIPLVRVFRNTYQALMEYYPEKNLDLRKIATIEPLIYIDIDSIIESGTSVPIHYHSEYKDFSTENIRIKIVDQSVADTNMLSIFGKNPGETAIEVYRIGNKIPIQILNVKVIKRNRIQKIILDEDKLVIGEETKKQLSVSWFPVDADNKNTISFKTSNALIATINQYGEIQGHKSGTCMIYVSAEQVSTKIRCDVKPFLEDIIIELPENNKLTMYSTERFDLKIFKKPEDAIDNDIIISTSNYNVVNVIGTCLYANNPGEANIIIKNSSERVKRSFDVKVSRKRGIFDFFKKKNK